MIQALQRLFFIVTGFSIAVSGGVFAHGDTEHHNLFNNLVRNVPNKEQRAFMLSNLTQVEQEDINKALQARGLYLTDTHNLAYLQSNICPLQVSAHRGHYNYPENSKLAVEKAAAGGFDGAEIDVRITKSGDWVVHHDRISGRAAARSNGKQIEIENSRTGEWQKLRLRDPQGKLTKQQPPLLRRVLTAWAKKRHTGQQLNIEIKSQANAAELASLNQLVTKALPSGSYFYSSLNFPVLQALRKLNADVYLSYIRDPHSQSIDTLRTSLRSEAKTNDAFNYNRHYLILSDDESHDRRLRKTKIVSAGMIRSELGANSGLQVDIRSFVLAPAIYSSAKQAGLNQVTTYSINGTEYHQQMLRDLNQQQRSLPDQAVMDTSKFKICNQLYPELTAPQSDYQGSTDYGRAIMRLPNDADYLLLEEQMKYLKYHQYIGADGQKKLLNKNRLLLVN